MLRCVSVRAWRESWSARVREVHYYVNKRTRAAQSAHLQLGVGQHPEHGGARARVAQLRRDGLWQVERHAAGVQRLVLELEAHLGQLALQRVQSGASTSTPPSVSAAVGPWTGNGLLSQEQARHSSSAHESVAAGPVRGEAQGKKSSAVRSPAG